LHSHLLVSSPAIPAVSILLPTYNGERHLEEQLDSILTQSWSDFELLAVDDGSSDGTPAILQTYAARDARIRVLPSSGNIGQTARLWELAQASRAPLVSIADQDDVWHPDKTRRLVDALGDNAMSYGRSELVDAAARPLGATLIERVGPVPQPADRLSLLFFPRVSAHAMMVRRELLSEMAFRRHQSFDWLIALEAVFSTGVAYVDEAIVYHRLHAGNQTNASVGLTLAPTRRWTLGRLYAEVQASRRNRFNFLARLEHLAHSSVIETSIARRFSYVASLCRNAWFLPGATRPISNRRLQALLVEALEPLAGSRDDWALAGRYLTDLVRSPYNARSILSATQTWLFGGRG
jgi:glycosyltransferase involved in cell wall biosynthesis